MIKSYLSVKAHFKYVVERKLFMVPSVMCCEDKADRKATNYVGIICVRIFKYVNCASPTQLFFSY